MIKNFILKILVTFVLFAAAGCGYHFTGGGTLPAGSGAVGIDNFENRSSEAGLESKIANSLIYEFIRNGQKVNKGDMAGGSYLRGVITSVYEETASSTTADGTLERRIYVVVDVRLVSIAGEILWEGSGIREKEVYTVDSANPSGTETENRKAAAIDELVKRLAEAVYGQMTVDF